jgi:hypothetical protein
MTGQPQSKPSNSRIRGPLQSLETTDFWLVAALHVLAAAMMLLAIKVNL